MTDTPRIAALLTLAGVLLVGCGPQTGLGDTADPLAAAEPVVLATDGAERAGGDEAASVVAANAEAERRATAQAALAARREAKEAARTRAADLAAEEAQRDAKRAAEQAARELAEEQARLEQIAENKEHQEILKDLGYYEGAIDGDIGPQSTAAVKAFQEVNELKVDGVIGDQTIAALESDDAKPKPPPEPEPEEKEKDEDGDDGPIDDGEGVMSVSDAQRVLRDEGYYLGEIDGAADGDFSSALMAFQKVNGIGTDGQLGPESSAALRNPKDPSLRGGNSTRIEIDLTDQVIHLVKDGARVKTMPTSSGNGEEYETSSGGTATALTPVGNFRIERRIKGLREADLGSLYDPLYFYRGWAIHGSNHVPPYPASHGCTRLTRSDATWLFNQVPDGTQVLVYGGTHTFSP